MDDHKALLDFLADQTPWDERSHADWYRARAQTSDPAMQQALSVPEHRAFSREFTQDHPVFGVGVPLAALGYYLGKKTGAIKSRTPADMDQVFGAVQGTLQGYGLDK
jgi:hypothetical protein